MSIPIHQRPYQPCADFRERLALSTKVIEAVYQIQGPFNLRIEMRKKVFWAMVWMLSESTGKYGTRYRSKSALAELPDEVQHEHVFPIAHLYYLSRHGLSVRDALNIACGCIVTKDEHDRLSQRDKLPDPPLGWRRYESSRIEVFDFQKNRMMTLTEMEAQTAPFETAMRQARFFGDGEVDLELEKRARDGGAN